MKHLRFALWGVAAAFAVMMGETSGNAAVTNLVEVRGPTAYIFVPSNLVVNVGDTVLWTNRSGVTHDVTQGSRLTGVTPNPYWASANIAAAGRFSVTFSNLGAYPYICNAHVFVNPQPAGNPTQTGLVTVVTANFAPTVAITAPTNLSRFAAPAGFILSADAADSDGNITNVQFFAGANSLGSATAAPYSINVNNLAAGAYQLTARASDNLGGISTSAVVHVLVNTNHTVTTSGFTFVPNALTVTLGDTVTFTGLTGHTVTGTNAALLQEPFCGTASVPTCSVTFNTVGFFGYRCIPHSAFGMVGSVTVVGPNLRPFVTLTAPANGAVFGAPATVNLTAEASDFAGAIASVRFVRGGTQNIFLDTTSPYAGTNTGLAVGNYVLTAWATDNTGLITTSAPVNISVVNALPIELRSPAVSAGGFKFDFTANPGTTYIIEGSANEGSPTPFAPIATNVATNSVMTFTDPAANSRSNRAYRVVRPQ